MKTILALICYVWLSVSAFAIESDKIFKMYSNNGKDEWCATAFFYTETRLLTAAHTFKKGGTRHVIIKEGRTVVVKLIKIDYKADIAVLECSEKNATCFEFSTAIPSKGEQVSALGFCQSDHFLTDLKETVKSVGKKIDCKPDGVDGMSGCPLVDSSGKVVGMLVSGWGGTSHSVKAETLKAFIEK
jgi:S1-C subfamily serine protease